MKKKLVHTIYPALLFCFSLWFFGCESDVNQAGEEEIVGSICVVLAHPDDETIISGTLAKLSRISLSNTLMYVTSGDDGPDETDKGLNGNVLAKQREKETLQALRVVGMETPPVFLGYPDSHVPENVDSVRQSLVDLFVEMAPQLVIGFGQDGITGDLDHKSTGIATDLAFDQTNSGKLLLHMAITKPLPPFYAGGVTVPRNRIGVRVDVSRYNKQKNQVIEAYKTQFNRRTRSAYKIFVHLMRQEKFSIARNRDANDLLERYFN